MAQSGRAKGVQIGEVYNKLTVVEFVGYTPNRRKQFKCICECGNEIITQSRYLTRGTRKDCGCGSPERLSRASRLAPGEALRNRLIDNYRRNASKRGYSFELTTDEVISLFQQKCHYCGDSPSKTISHEKHYGDFTYNGIDRKNPTLGYTVENSVTCCETCNYMKSAMHYEDFIQRIKRIADNL